MTWKEELYAGLRRFVHSEDNPTQCDYMNWKDEKKKEFFELYYGREDDIFLDGDDLWQWIEKLLKQQRETDSKIAEEFEPDEKLDYVEYASQKILKTEPERRIK